MVFKEWEYFCSKISNENCIRVDEIQKQNPDSRWLSIKHDVETNVSKALQFAQIEARHGIRATYFVQSYLLETNVDLLSEISKLGHEVTYHYDVLDSNFGDMDAATSEFSDTIARFQEKGFPVRTVCPHGNPMMKRVGWNSNKDFFRDKKIASNFSGIFDLVVHGENVIGKNSSYVSDAGYQWKLIGDIGTNDIDIVPDRKINGVSEMFDLIESENSVIISSHPHRWSSTYFGAFISVSIFRIVRMLARFLGKFGFFKNVMTKFYYLAKKI